MCTKVLELVEVTGKEASGSREKTGQPASRSESLNMGQDSKYYRQKLQKRAGKYMIWEKYNHFHCVN